MGMANSEQHSFRGRDDDVTLNSTSFTHLLNADFTQLVDVAFRLRWEIEEDAGGTFNVECQLQSNLAGGGWNDVNAGSGVVQSLGSGQFTDGDATTNVLVSSGLTFDANEGESADGLCGNVQLSNEHTEPEYCIQIIGVDVADAQTIQFRIVDGVAGSVMDVITETPTITVDKPAVTVSMPPIQNLHRVWNR